MVYHLLDEAWIPVRRLDGTVERIPPWRITDRGRRGRFVDVMSPRPDFDAALLEFLIGFVQTVFTPANEDEWFGHWDSPPTPEQLQKASKPFRDAFALDGDGPRFMQDREALPAKEKPIVWLFMDAPAENTEEENRDLFIKRRGFQLLCPGCAAAALFTLQNFASGGGSGHYSSLRRKGPLSTLVLGEDLWHTVWANVLNRSQLNAEGEPSSTIRFPWMPSKNRNSSERRVLPTQVHPVYRYWGMPRRIWLVFETLTSTCDLCGLKTDRTVAEYFTRPKGNKYEGPWRHPLTPYCIRKGEPLAIEGAMDSTGYRHWLGITLGARSGDVVTEPAQVIRTFADRRKEIGGDHPDFRIRAHGYAMDKKKVMKAQGFCFSEMPVWLLPTPKLREAFAFEVQRLVSAAEAVAEKLRKAIFEAIVHEHRGGRQRGGLAGRTLFETLTSQFWSETESAFYACLSELHPAVREGQDTLSIRETWRRRLAAAAMDLFEQATSFIDAGGGDIKRVVKAQRGLRNAVGPWSRDMQKRLDLPPPSPAREDTEEGALA